jgi:hypothetical protein
MRTIHFAGFPGLAALIATLAGCGSNADPASFVSGLRVLVIAADPPEVAVGATATIAALAIDTDGTPIAMAWAQCLAVPNQGDAINPSCITNAGGDDLVPVGSGLAVTTTMPNVTPAELGLADASGGYYLPLIAHATAGADALTASYLLRLNRGAPPNQNPSLTAIAQLAADGVTLTALDPSTSLVVHAGDELTLRATFAAGSAESYAIDDGSGRTFTETLSIEWFSTAGYFEDASSGADVRDTIMHLDAKSGKPSPHLPPSGSTIDLWAVARDERGGASYLRRTLQLD